ncbi:MAG: SAM-dependent methyltransferase, partial [Anaerotignum sp.]|nr:SAM-dependent methyltransferase [Anaerotignum sp.]
RIKVSYDENPRELLLFFYYPSKEYLSYLEIVEELEFYDEISCTDLFDREDQRERIVIFSMKK